LRKSGANGVNLCGAHHPLILFMADFRPFLIALFAITTALFALAQLLRKRKNGPAFQASSPKNFQRAGFDRPSFFARSTANRLLFPFLSFDPGAGPPM
jgi:hypothetical protein